MISFGSNHSVWGLLLMSEKDCPSWQCHPGVHERSICNCSRPTHPIHAHATHAKASSFMSLAYVVSSAEYDIHCPVQSDGSLGTVAGDASLMLM